MDAQIKKGLLDACVLTLLRKDASYGYRIAADMQSIVDISESTLYPVLRRLEQSGYLDTSQRPHNGRMRKYYNITSEGRQKLSDMCMEWQEAARVIDYVIKESESA